MKKKKQQSKAGFSLVEFIVILTLFSIMASVVTFDFQRFQTQIDRSNLATDIALAFRQMQVYGISSSNREIGAVGFDGADATGEVQALVNANLIQDTSSYGVHVHLDEQRITLFQEVGGNPAVYDEGTDVVIDVLAITGKNQILRVCASEEAQEPEILYADGSCNFSLSQPGEEIQTGTFTAIFKRPFPDASYYGSAFSSSGFDTQIALLVIGPAGITADELRFIYLDAVGLIQNITPTIVGA